MAMRVQGMRSKMKKERVWQKDGFDDITKLFVRASR